MSREKPDLMPLRGWHAGIALLLVAAACGRNLKTIPPTLEAISLLGDTLWSVPVPIQGGRDRVNRIQDARERLIQSPGNFQAAYDVARYTADLGRFTQAINLYGDAVSMGGLDPRPYARRGELYLRLRRIDRAWADLRTAERLETGDQLTEQQVTNWGEMVPHNFGYAIPNLLGIVSLVRGEESRATEYFKESATKVEALREAVEATLWARAGKLGTELPSTLPGRFRSATIAMIRNSTRGAGPNGCPTVTGTMVDRDLLCIIHGSRLLSEGRRDEAIAAYELVRSRSHWSSEAHLVAEAALVRLYAETEAAASAGRRGGR